MNFNRNCEKSYLKVTVKLKYQGFPDNKVWIFMRIFRSSSFKQDTNSSFIRTTGIDCLYFLYSECLEMSMISTFREGYVVFKRRMRKRPRSQREQPDFVKNFIEIAKDLMFLMLIKYLFLLEKHKFNYIIMTNDKFFLIFFIKK